MKKISAEKIDQVRSMLRCGMRGDDIADRVGVSTSTVNKVRKEEQIKGFDIWHKPGVISKTIKL